jgi:ATP-dependent exoDNAse (exonuclease V) beta subunit
LDEFQDTSYLQWQNLKPMVEEALSTDGSLFYVGDKKQAIYRFRGGEAALINSVKERFHGFNFIQQNLNINYRSRKEIVEFNNSVFSEANLARFFSSKEEAKKGGIEFTDEDIQEIIEVFGDSRQSFRKDKPGGYVQSEFLDYQTRQEAEDALRVKLITLLNDLNKRFAYGDIVLLARENSQVELLTGWLLAANIPVESEKTLDIRQNAYIKELVSFLRFLNSPIDNLSFASFILGDIFLRAAGLDAKVIQDFLFSLQVKKQEGGVYIYREFRLKFPVVWDELIEDFFKNVGFVPLYELMISIFHKFKVMDDFAGYQGFFMRLLEMIKTEEEDNFSIAGFLESFDKPGREGVYVNASESDAVKIITIHKSKGLEFPVVVLPFLEMNVRADNECLVADGLELKLIRLKKKYADFSSALERLYRDGYTKSFIDELLNMYVSFTRAKDELYIFVSRLSQNSFNLAQIFLPENNFTRGALVQDHTKTRAAKPPIEIPPSQYKDWIGILKDEFIDEGVILGRENIRRGEVLHYLLSCIGNLPASGFALEIQEALKRARVKFPFINDFSEYKAVMDKLLADKILGGYFRFEHGQIYREKEIIDHLGLTKRIDRLLVNSREAVVIDYKSSRDLSGRYSAQVKEYMSIIGQIYPEKNVRGVLVYLDDLSVEEV